MSENHEHRFVEEQEPEGRLILGPCLICDLSAMDAMEALRLERDKLQENCVTLMVLHSDAKSERDALNERQVTDTAKSADLTSSSARVPAGDEILAIRAKANYTTNPVYRRFLTLWLAIYDWAISE